MIVTIMAMGIRNVFECIKGINLTHVHKKGCFVLFLLLLFYTCTGHHVKNNKFDYLVFSQRWLPTACIEYIEKNTRYGNPHFCILPKNYKTWSIHGLWPTQDNALGPFYCNRSMHFDVDKIRPIETDLEIYWPNVEGGKNVASLWQHEWEKHGTCAAQLESLNNEMKYFNKSLTLYKTHNMQIIFTKNGIFPSQKGISVTDLFYTLKSNIGKMPQIHCVQLTKTKQFLLSEIRLCYNNNLELIDCKDIHGKELGNSVLFSGLTNCPNDRYIIFPDNTNLTLEYVNPNKNSGNSEYFKKLYDVLLIIRFLQWVSL